MNQPDVAPCHAEYWNIPKLDNSALADIQHIIDHKTKPPGALGQLEELASTLANIQGLTTNDYTKIQINQPCILVFAADHGIATHPISIAPREVTAQMVHNFIAGGAAINCFCNSVDVALKVINAGVMTPLAINHNDYINQPSALGTEDFSVKAAMTSVQLEHALLNGQKVAQQQIEAGSNLLGFGEMGIGNTTTASTILSAISGLPAKQTTGKGTGISDEQLDTKIALIDKALLRLQQDYPSHTLSAGQILQEVGGFEIAQIVGAMLATASAGKTIIVDGFIVSIAALLACRIAPNARQFMLFAHCSAEQAHQTVLSELAAQPLLDLGLRLGEGTGAALAVPLIKAAAEFYNNMATFESAQVKVN